MTDPLFPDGRPDHYVACSRIIAERAPGTPTRVIFLDVDGVLNSHDYVANRRDYVEEGGRIGIDPQAVTRLNRLVYETSAEVVISSTWRMNHTRAEMAALLEAKGFVGVVRGMTPEHVERTKGALYTADRRGNEIHAWLHAAPQYGIDVEAFVILDDDSDMAHLADRHIKTSFDHGLTEADVERAIVLMRTPPPVLLTPQTAPAIRWRP